MSWTGHIYNKLEVANYFNRRNRCHPLQYTTSWPYPALTTLECMWTPTPPPRPLLKQANLPGCVFLITFYSNQEFATGESVSLLLIFRCLCLLNRSEIRATGSQCPSWGQREVGNLAVEPRSKWFWKAQSYPNLECNFPSFFRNFRVFRKSF